MKIYILRHARTEWNSAGKIQGRTDIDISEEGIKQAENIRESIENLNIDTIICSPLLRAKRTAEIVNKNMKVPIIIDDRIIERDYGAFEGVDKSTVDFKSAWKLDGTGQYETMESPTNLFSRIEDFLQDVKKKYYNQNILIITHGGLIRGMNYVVNKTLGLDELNKFSVPNCSIVTYEI